MLKNGQLQQIGITPDNHLVYGGRRLEAAKLLGWTEIDVKEVDCDSLLAEQDENVVRKAFTVSEQLAIAAALVDKLKERHGTNRFTNIEPGNCPPLEKGESRELAAKKAGFGSARTMQRAQEVIGNGAPELVEALTLAPFNGWQVEAVVCTWCRWWPAVQASDQQAAARARHGLAVLASGAGVDTGTVQRLTPGTAGRSRLWALPWW